MIKGLYADKFAEKYLFDPLGISDFNWQKLPDGTIITAWGLKLKPRDMAKIGYMMLKDGKWKGKQIVSSTWVRESTKAHVEEDILLESGYGYQWWRGRIFINNKNIEIFYAAGKGGQYIFVCPALDLITVFTSKSGNDGMGEFRPQIIMIKYIIPAMLSPSPPRRTVKLDSKIVGKYVGDYEFQRLNLPLTIFREGDILFFKGPHGEKGELFPETETRFKIWDISLFYRHLWLYAGVIGFLFITNMLTWHGSIWFHWPALGWGLLIFLHWIKGSKVSSRRKP